MTDRDVHRARLALLVAVLDGDCGQRCTDLLHRDDRPGFALDVAHDLAHLIVAGIDPGDHAEMRADLVAELLDLAGQ